MYKSLRQLRIAEKLKRNENNQCITGVFDNDINISRLQADIKSYASRYGFKSIISSSRVVFNTDTIGIAIVIYFEKKEDLIK